MEILESVLGEQIERESIRAVNNFQRYTDIQLRSLQRLYIDARANIQAQIVDKFPMSITGDIAELPVGAARLRQLDAAIALELETLKAQVNKKIPQVIGKAGSMGVTQGQIELARIMKSFPDIRPSWTLLNMDAIRVYSDYALQLSNDYIDEARRQIQSALRQGLIEGKTVGQLTTQIRQYIGAEYRKPNKALTYKAQRIARTEMSRAYAQGHTAYGKSTDWVIGEEWHFSYRGPWPCAQCETISADGQRWLYKDGDRPHLPVHPQCRCYTTYLYRSELFTKEEIDKMKIPVAPGVGVPAPKVDRSVGILDTLRTGKITRAEDIGWGITNPQHIYFENTTLEACGKAKYIKGEIASYRISKRFGGTVIPETTGRTIGTTKYSLQRWVKNAKIADNVPGELLVDVIDYSKKYKEMQIWDYLFGNTDRHVGNWLVVGKNKVWAIDNGFTFNMGAYQEARLRSTREVLDTIKKMPKSFMNNIAKIAKTKASVLRNIAAQNISLQEANELIRRATAVARYAGLDI